MLNGVLLWVAKFAAGKYIVNWLAWAHNLVDGKKSEILAALYGLVYGLKVLGILSAEQSQAVENVLLPLLPVVLADRASKIKASIEKMIP